MIHNQDYAPRFLFDEKRIAELHDDADDELRFEFFIQRGESDRIWGRHLLFWGDE